MNLKRIVFILSLVLNLILTYFFLLYINERKNDESNTNHFFNVYLDEKGELQKSIVYDQLFYGTWKIVAIVPPEEALPSRYGPVRMPDANTIIGTELTFNGNYIEHDGEKHELVYGYRTYSNPLNSESDRIFYNRSDTLGITGNYYSIVFFVHPNSDMTKEFFDRDRPNQIFIDDLRYLLLKDNNTIYASNSVLTYRLERVIDE